MKRFPLESLLKVRSQRERIAFGHVVEQRAKVDSCERSLKHVEGELTQVESHIESTTIELFETAKQGHIDIARFAAYRVHLSSLKEDRVDTIAKREQAQTALDEANAVQQEKLRVHRLARTREDNAQRQKGEWRKAEYVRGASLEERTVEELIESGCIAHQGERG